LAAGTWFLKELGDHPRQHDPLNPIIGGIVLFMLVLALLRSRLGERFAPHGKFGTRMTGVLGGFTTMVSNAAGPVMQIYLVSTGMPKQQLMGTTATYFFLINTVKVAPLIWLTLDNPSKPLFTMASLRFDLFMLPLILIGAYGGRKLLPYIPQKAFNNTVLVLSEPAATRGGAPYPRGRRVVICLDGTTRPDLALARRLPSRPLFARGTWEGPGSSTPDPPTRRSRSRRGETGL
jgi:hypothetical protein